MYIRTDHKVDVRPMVFCVRTRSCACRLCVYQVRNVALSRYASYIAFMCVPVVVLGTPWTTVYVGAMYVRYNDQRIFLVALSILFYGMPVRMLFVI